MDKSKITRWAIVAGVAVVLITALVHFGPRYLYSWFGDLALSEEHGGPNARQKEAIRRTIGNLRARIAWSSSRSGNHELYILELPSLNIRRLTHNDFVDFFPRFSPDGQKLVFSRSTEPWVSERDSERWDTWIMDLASGQEQRVAQGGTTPRWVDGKKITFQRGRQVMLKDLKSGRETVLLDGSDPEVDARIYTPQLCPTHRNLLAFTARGKLHGVYVASLAEQRYVRFGDGCEMGWFPDGRRLLWIETKGNGKTRAVASSLDATKTGVLIDLPGEFSHEYFLSLSQGGRWLVWGASAGGHEHDVADYELFLWRVGSPAEKAVRLTYNAANDRWPDIYTLP
jgi:dipeptidyl aminopeptidase/acylaminoacyl peptidase